MNDYEDDDYDGRSYNEKYGVGVETKVDSEGDTTTVKATIDRSGLIKQAIDDAIKAATKKKFESFIEERASRVIDEVVADMVRPRVAQLLNEGWQTYGSYGHPGPRVTLAECIANWFKTSNDYGSRDRNIYNIITSAISAHLKDGFDKEMAEAQKEFRKRVDELLAGKIAEGLRSALGLR